MSWTAFFFNHNIFVFDRCRFCERHCTNKYKEDEKFAEVDHLSRYYELPRFVCCQAEIRLL